MALLNNLSVKTRITIVALFPSLALLAVGAHQARNSWLTLKESRVAEASLGRAVAAGRLIHELQKERGLSAGFLGSGGTGGNARLTEQRAKSDEMLKLVTLPSGAGSLKDTRAGVDALALKPAESSRWYTGAIALLTADVTDAANRVVDPGLRSAFEGYHAILNLKEAAGQERAALNAVFAKGSGDVESLRRVAGIVAQQGGWEAAAIRHGGPELAEELKKVSAEHGGVVAMRERALAKAAETRLESSSADWFAAASARIDALKKLEDLTAAHVAEKARISKDRALLGLVLGGALPLCLAMVVIVVGRFVFVSIARPLSEMDRAMAEIASGDGDLTRQLAVVGSDELATLSRAFNDFAGNIRQIVQQAQQAAATAAGSSDNLTASAREIAGAAGATAGQVTCMATAAEELTATANTIAGNCLHASEQAARASSVAAHGNQVINGTLEDMRQISELISRCETVVTGLGQRSEEIGGIVDTIQAVAEQTNLLALNAAIEAARAGEQGRGFAVVADEVRRLAERTSNATRDVASVITAIQGETLKAVEAMQQGVRRVEEGIASSRNSQQAMTDIVAAIGTVTGQVQEIATAAEEQSMVATEISTTAQQVDLAIGESAGQACTMADEAARVAALAAELAKTVGRFRT